MKKRVLIIHSDMEIGGAETSLIGLLGSFDYSKTEVDLFLMEQKGELLELIPEQVNLLPERPEYRALVSKIKEALYQGKYAIALARICGKIIYQISAKLYGYTDRTYELKKLYQKLAIPFLSDFSDEYDMAISYIDPHYILQEKTRAKIRLGWVHTDFSRINTRKKQDAKMWERCDYIVNVSASCTDAFTRTYPQLSDKAVTIENILLASYINKEANALVEDAFQKNEGFNLLSIGRFCEQKSFDNVPMICKLIRKAGLNVKWYLIGYGGDEALIRQRIQEAGMQEYVVILGKRSNPYPYIKACDLYVQPSRYEGKCVTVREAQMLGKPVVITNYATSASQLEDGVDGVVVPMDNEGCAAGIAALLRDPRQMERLAQNCRERDYSNAAEVEKLYEIME